VVGLVAGLGLGIAAALALGSFLVGVSPADPVTVAAVIVTILGSALAASALPAWRAARVDPLIALKCE